MKIQDITSLLEKLAPPSLQEDYDNAGLLTGSKDWECTGVLVCLDATDAVVQEAIEKNCNLIVAHHPIIFKGLKKINGKNYVEQAVIRAIKNDIALFAIHTNLDNVIGGVNGKIADKLGLTNRKVLLPKMQQLQKLAVFVPATHHAAVEEELFAAGAGNIGNYSECGFSVNGTGNFKPGEGSQPFSGTIGHRHTENEIKLEVLFPVWLKDRIIKAMLDAHPYEEVAFDIYALENRYDQVGSGMVGELASPVDEKLFLASLSEIFGIPCIRHTALRGRPVKKVAVCGGAGSFLTFAAKAAGADIYVSSDIKYHEFFDADGRLVIADIGHYESEQYTMDLLFDILSDKFTTFAVLKTGVITNPVQYF